jgi:hypothetical protein
MDKFTERVSRNISGSKR